MKKVTRFISTTFAILSLFAFSACNFGNTDNNSEEQSKKNQKEALSSFFSESEKDFPVFYTSGKVSVSTDEVYSNWKNSFIQTDTHGDVIKITFIESYDKNKNTYYVTDSYLELAKITPVTDSYLVFDYKTSFFAHVKTNAHEEKPYYSESLAKLYVDDYCVANIGYNGNTIWRNKGVKLTANKEHTVRWFVAAPNGNIYHDYTNSLYLDNIKLVSPLDFEAIDISPKGQQDTVVDVPLKFTASANWTDEKPTITCSGGTIDENGYFTATTAGVYTIQASLNGITSDTISVKVHDKNYLETEPYTVPLTDNYTFTGKVTDLGTKNISDDLYFSDSNSNSYKKYSLSSLITFNSPTPDKTSFSADGFFVISGKVNTLPPGFDKLYLYVYYYTKNNTYIYTSYPLEDSFYQRIWLNFDRFDNGQGEYDVFIAAGKKTSQKNSKGEEVSGFIINYAKDPLFTVHNSSEYTKKLDYRVLPSSFINVDSFEVSNAVHDALYGHTSDSATIQLQLIHDWIKHHFYYDYTSLDAQKRAPQNSIYCIRNNKALCEGYASVFAAMVRNIGYCTSYLGSQDINLNHAWNTISWSDGTWKLVDVTWDDTLDDPDKSIYNTDILPYSECYKYFLVDENGINNDHKVSEFSKEARTLKPFEELKPTFIRDLPDGWY